MLPYRPRALAVSLIFNHSTRNSSRRCCARLCVMLLVTGLLLPPAAPVLAAGSAERPAAAAARDIQGAAQQADEPDAGDPYATEPAGPPDPLPVIPAVPIAGVDEGESAILAAPPEMMQAAGEPGGTAEELPVEDPLLPVLLEVTAERGVLALGETLALTVSAALAVGDGAPLPPLEVTLVLPAGLVTADGQHSLVWSGLALSAEGPFVQTLAVQLDADNPPVGEVLEIGATAAGAGYSAVAVSLLLGAAAGEPAPVAEVGEGGAVVESADSEVALLAPPGVLPEGATLQITELFNGLDALTPTVTPTVMPTVTPTVMPTVMPTVTPAATPDLLPASPVDTDAAAEEPRPDAPPTATPAALFLPFASSLLDANLPTNEDTGRNIAPEATPQPGSGLGLLSADADTATLDDANLQAFRIWQLDAVVDGEEVQFDGEVLLRVSVAPWLALGVEPGLLQLWTREQEGEGWTPLPAALDAEQGVLEAYVPHFSQFGLGAGLDTSGDSLPSVKAFTVDALNGGAGLHLPVDVPQGLGGLAPGFSFDYSSIGVDDLFRVAGEREVQAQAGSIGLGWSLGGVSYIARADNAGYNTMSDTAKEFALVLNGERVSIVYQGDRWRTNPETFARVEWHGGSIAADGTHTDHDSGASGYKTEDFYGWSVFTPDGLRYDFGDPNPFSGQFVGYSPTMTFLAKSGSGQDIRLAKRWYLRQVTDPSGNTMLYNYAGEKNIESSNSCVGESWRNDSARNWYTRSIDVTEVLWNGNPSLGQGYTLKLAFTYGTRSDTLVKGSSPTDCLQPLYGAANRLTKVTVAAYAGTSWQTLRTYELEQTTRTFNYTGFPTQRRLLLTGLVQRGKDGAAALGRYDFAYNAIGDPNLPSNPNTTVLVRAAHSGRGTMNYAYAWHKISCSGGVCPDLPDSAPGNLRHAVVQTAAEDGQDHTVYTRYYYGPTQPAANSEWGAVANDGGFLGFQEVQVTHYAVNSTAAGSVLQWERLLSVDGSSGADAGIDNPDPRRGKLERREVWSAIPPLNTEGISLPAGSPGGNGVLLQTDDYLWRAYWFLNGDWSTTPTTTSWRSNNGAVEYPPTWVRQETNTVTLYTGVQVANGARRFYEAARQGDEQYGNVTQVEEWADRRLQRRTVRDYFPNVVVAPVTDWEGLTTNEVVLYIADRAARERVYDGVGACAGEVRSSYDRYTAAGNNYTLPPTRGLLSERDVALASCSDALVVATNDPAWQVERFGYDAYGNRTIHHQMAAVDGSTDRWTITDYDPVYHLFPVKVYDSVWTQFAETASYYGVNAISSGESKPLSDPWAYWGAMAEWCDVNDVCVRQAYDAHGRRTLRWENVPEGAAWASDATSATAGWDYRDPLNNPTWNDTTVTEWRAPKCEGNFVRRHYDGFGQLTQEQRPAQGWYFHAFAACGASVAPLPEVDIDYLYDGLGRQIWASIPHATTADWINRAAYWGEGYTITQYDALGRVTQTTAPNGEATTTAYSGRDVKVTGIGRNGYPNKVLQWTQTDESGNLRYVRTANSSGGEQARVTLTHDALGNLIQVSQPGPVTTTLTYDLGGRKRVMTDPDLGTWRYDYNRQGQLTYQTDGCGNLLALRYDRLGRLAQETATPGSGCLDSRLTTAATTTNYVYDGGHSASNRSRGQMTQVSYADGSYSKALAYNAEGQLASATVSIGGAPGAFTSRYGYDGYDRPLTTTWPDGDVTTVTGYDSGSRPTGLKTSLWGQTQTLVDSVSYDAAGRLVQLRYLYGNGVWVSHYYRAWLGSNGNSNGRYWGMNVGHGPGGTDIFTTWYGYDTYGNPVGYATSEGGIDKDSAAFGYDVQNRVTSGYGESFIWQNRGALASFNGAGFGYDSAHTHAVSTVGGADRYDYDLNGSMTVRNKGLGNQQRLKWDSHGRLAQIVGGGVNESYLYDETGQRVRQTNNLTGVSTFYPVGGYEQTGSNVTKQYSFGGRFVAVRGPSGALSFLLQDQLSSTVYVLDAYSNKQASRGYYTFGATRFIEGTMPTDYHFTGQREDGTGLYYYNSRFYDPYLGNFISPDTVVPDPTKLIDYNRYLYAAGNPVKYNDPTGHQAACAAGDRWCWENRYYNAHGYFWDQNTNHWALTNNAQFADEAILDDTVLEAGVQWDSMAGFAAWTFDQKVKVATGIVKFGQNLSGGLGRIRTLVGGQATMQIGSGADYGCRGGAVPCALPVWVNVVRWPADFVDNNPLDYVAATAVHELAHVIDWQSGIRFSHAWAGRGYRDLTVYGGCQLPGCVHNWESWAESVATFVYGANYINNLSPQGPVPRGPTAAELNLQINAVQALLEGWVQP